MVLFVDFKKENGFHEMPSAFAGSPESPYNIPVVGQEKMVDHGGHGDILGYNVRSNSQFGDSVDNFDGGMEDLAPFSDFGGDHHYFDNDDDGLNTGASPFKYHHDVSSNGLKGDSLGFDDQVRNLIINCSCFPKNNYKLFLISKL